MPRDVARSIWVDTPRSVVANTPVPTARAVVVPGGYRVTGRQGFSTGCRHACWLAARALVVENGQLRLQDRQPEQLYLFVPVAEAELLDTWQVRGMRGTGTYDFAVNDVFVPAERTVLQTGAPLLETGPLYQIPRSLLFAAADGAISLGYLTQRDFQDIHVSSQHLQGRLSHYELVGQHLLGFKLDETRY